LILSPNSGHFSPKTVQFYSKNAQNQSNKHQKQSLFTCFYPLSAAGEERVDKRSSVGVSGRF
jgi:hypothetical protein